MIRKLLGCLLLISCLAACADPAPNPTDTVTADEPIVLQLATCNTSSGIAIAVTAFNRANTQYQIELTDYAHGDDMYAGLTRLNNEIIAGEIPDLFAWGDGTFSPLTADRYLGSGLLADLYPMLERDTDLSAADFLPNLLQALETSDGQLLELPLDFFINVTAGSQSLFGDTPGCTVEQALTILEEHPTAEHLFSASTPPQYLLRSMLAENWTQLIDHQTGQCTFDSPNFISLLQLCAKQPDVEDYLHAELFKREAEDGRLLLVKNSVGNVSEVKRFRPIFEEDVVLVGMPTAQGAGNSFHLMDSVSISSTTAYPDVCWSFLSSLCDRDFQLEHFTFFPPLSDVLNQRIQTTLEETTENVTYFYSVASGDSWNLVIEPPTQEDVEALWTLIDSLDRVHRINQPLIELITKEANSYFNNEKSAEEVAKVIQNQVSTYLNE